MKLRLVCAAVLLCSCGSDEPLSRSSGSSAGGGPNGEGDAGARAAGAEPDSASSGSAPDAGRPRRFRLATTGAQLVVSGPDTGLELTDANLKDDADVFSIHQEFYGVPWDAFEANTAPPPEWVAVMDRLAASATLANRPVFLSISMLDGQRQRLAAKTTVVNGQVKTQENWSAACYDFRTAPDAASKRDAYLRYVAFMVNEFHPAYLNLAIEVNLFFEKCGAAATGLIDVIDAAYDAVKSQAPDTVVFPSIQIDHLYGYSKDSCADPSQRAACFEAAYAVLAPIRRDRFAMSTYPYMNGFATPADLPSDWFTRGASRKHEVPLVAETGWPSTGIVARARDGTCLTLFSFDERESAAYLDRVLSDADSSGIDLVTWWSDRDLVVSELMTDCPCTFDATWCTVLDAFRGPPSTGAVDTQLFGEILLKAFGTMGLRAYDGTPKAEHYALWRNALARPYAP